MNDDLVKPWDCPRCCVTVTRTDCRRALRCDCGEPRPANPTCILDRPAQDPYPAESLSKREQQLMRSRIVSAQAIADVEKRIQDLEDRLEASLRRVCKIQNVIYGALHYALHAEGLDEVRDGLRRACGLESLSRVFWADGRPPNLERELLPWRVLPESPVTEVHQVPEEGESPSGGHSGIPANNGLRESPTEGDATTDSERS